jgi:hypothetical protein
MQFYKAWEVFRSYLRLVLALLTDPAQNDPCLFAKGAVPAE